ncbi:DUF5675 family protein [Methylobacterium sp. E-046]|uniref:DUF5675 family protein n=1 Tax=Methylobacterium sp. E-046 TaxID=2836576 RepID=UPI001FBBB57D|nr:DUF5675 family protein [Methylobacterium sp. E-046]MCJ2097490.1 DUF5675 family protein [Methylobacterium sp. E-046]
MKIRRDRVLREDQNSQDQNDALMDRNLAMRSQSRRDFLPLAAGFSGVLFLSKSVFAQASNFTLTLARKYKGDACTSGYLAADGTIIAYTLERPWKGNAPLISSIPDGRYEAVLRYDHTDQWRIELTGVPGRTNVQIHTGNKPDDSEGCILIGLKLSDDLCSVLESKKAYAALKKAFYGTETPNSTPNKNIIVVVVS